MDILSKFQSIWDGDLACINPAKYHIEPISNNKKHVHPALYRTVPKPREFKQAKIDNMLQKEVLKTTQMKWAERTVFASKKDGTFRLCVDFRKIHAVSKRFSYPI